MNRDTPVPKISQLVQIKDEVNASSARLGKNVPVFRNLQTPPLEYTCSEAGFLRVVSWFYTLYYEAGKISIDFLIEKFQVYDLDPEGKGSAHINAIHFLRTTLQHSLDPNNKNDQNTEQSSSQWFISKCGELIPTNNDQWNSCLKAILVEGIEFLSTLIECIFKIEKDEFCNQIIQDWNEKCSNFHPKFEFEKLVSEVANDIGLSQLDPYKVCNIFYERWSKELEYLRSNNIFDVEARKLIERDLIRNPVLPITGADIILEFGIPPGKRVGEILRLAYNLYREGPCTANELLARLKEKLMSER